MDVTAGVFRAPRCDFLHVDDVVGTTLPLLRNVQELADGFAEVAAYRGETIWDPTKPDGTPRKSLGVKEQRNLDWAPRIPLRAGIEATYGWTRST